MEDQINMFKKVTFDCLLLVLVFAVSVVGQSASETVDAVVADEMAKQKIPGLALVVIKDGKTVKQGNYGMANVELNVPVTGDTVFKIASISKPMLAMGILQLAEQGKLNIDDKVSKHFTDAPATWNAITLRHLLSHTSGIVREAPGFNGSLIQADADVIKTAYPLPLRFTPGEKYEYCNVGYFMLAEIITRISGKPWTQYVREDLFAKAGMKASRETSKADIVPNRANAYLLENGEIKNAESFKAIRPSGAFLSTANDLINFDRALDNFSLLKNETQQQMWTPFKLNDGSNAPYGLGWQTANYRGKKQIGHGGSLNGFRLEYTRFPEDRVTIIILTNMASATPAIIVRRVAESYINFPDPPAATSNQ